MADHKFKVGQIVEPSSGVSKADNPRYEITGLVPNDGFEPRYRVKRSGAPERVVQQSQIAFVADAPAKSTRPSISISKGP